MHGTPIISIASILIKGYALVEGQVLRHQAHDVPRNEGIAGASGVDDGGIAQGADAVNVVSAGIGGERRCLLLLDMIRTLRPSSGTKE
jgi:hypothetical protein